MIVALGDSLVLVALLLVGAVVELGFSVDDVPEDEVAVVAVVPPPFSVSVLVGLTVRLVLILVIRGWPGQP